MIYDHLLRWRNFYNVTHPHSPDKFSNTSISGHFDGQRALFPLFCYVTFFPVVFLDGARGGFNCRTHWSASCVASTRSVNMDWISCFDRSLGTFVDGKGSDRRD